MKSIFTHVTPWENFLSIHKQKYLIPKKCPLFKEELLYLSYNRLAHKPSKKDYNWNENSPVVLYFDSNIYRQSFRFFPFDTGAIISGRFTHSELNNTKVLNRLSFFTKTTTPFSWIKTKYSVATNYIKCKKPDLAFPNTFVNSVLNETYDSLEKANNILDYRLTSIECHFKNPISLVSAITIAVPSEKREEFSKLHFHSNCKIVYYTDISKNGYLPIDLTNISNKIFMN